MSLKILAAVAAAALLPASGMATDPAAKEQPAKEAAAEKPDPDSVIRCRRIQVTGSLARNPKVCKTVAEWRQQSERGNRNARDIVESGQSCAGGPLCSGG